MKRTSGIPKGNGTTTERPESRRESGSEVDPKSFPRPGSTSTVSANPVTLAIQRNYDEMREATLTARRSLDQFFNAFHHPQPNQTNFRVKVFFTHRHQVKHVWMADLDFSSATFAGTLIDDPSSPDVSSGQRRSFTRDRITDWMYIEDGKTVGAFTTEVLRKRQRAQKLSGLRRILGLKQIS